MMFFQTRSNSPANEHGDDAEVAVVVRDER